MKERGPTVLFICYMRQKPWKAGAIVALGLEHGGGQDQPPLGPVSHIPCWRRRGGPICSLTRLMSQSWPLTYGVTVLLSKQRYFGQSREGY